jgi:uncharacterized membrane protein (DUF4010 family)
MEAGIGIVFAEQIVLSLLIGALLGLEREYTKSQEIAGLRTFSLIALLGCLLGILSDPQLWVEVSGASPLPSSLPVYGFVGVGLLVLAMYVSNLFKFREIGLTTAISLLMVYVLGLFVSKAMFMESVFLAVIVTIVLFTKERLHQIVDNVTHKEMIDLLWFLVIIGLIYPFVPEQPIDFFSVALNLQSLWLLIVLMSVMNLIGFLGSRMLTTEASMALIGLLGGLISQKVSCASLSEAYKKTKNLEMVSASFLMTNGSVLVRNLVLIGIIVPSLIKILAVPAIGGFVALAGIGYFKMKKAKKMLLQMESPFNVRKAVMLSLKLFSIFVVLDVLNLYFHQLFFFTVFLGGIVSGASTIASIALLTAGNQITMMEAVMAFGIASVSELLVGHITVFWFDKSRKVIKHSLIPNVVGAIAFIVLLGIVCCL